MTPLHGRERRDEAPTPPNTLHLTPYVSALRDAADEALRSALRCPDPVQLTADINAHVTHITLQVAQGPALQVTLADAGAARGRVLASWGGQALTIGEDAATLRGVQNRALRAAVKAAARAVRVGALEDAMPALQEAQRFNAVTDRMFRWAGVYDGGHQGVLRLGFRCNQDCSFCWQGRRWPEPPGALYQTWLDEMAAAGIRRLFLTGGEPTIHRQFEALLARAAQHGMRVCVQTNAVTMARGGRAARYRELGLGAVSVSLHAGDAALSDHMTRAPRTFQRTVDGIRASLDAGLPVNLTCVVEAANVHHLEQHARFILDHFTRDGDQITVAYAHPAGYFDQALWEAALVPLDVSGPRVAAAAQILMACGVYVNTQGGCGFPPCSLRDAPTLWRALPPEQLHPGELAGRQYAPACADCALRSGCIGVRREYWDRFGDRGLRPFHARDVGV